MSSPSWLASREYASTWEIRSLMTEWVYEVFNERPAPTNLWCRKPDDLVLNQSPAMAERHRICQPDVHRSEQHMAGKKRGFIVARQYSREMQGSHRTMGVWQFTFTGFNMTHSLLAKTELQQEIDSKNKDQAPSAFPLVLYIFLWYWYSHWGMVDNEAVRILPNL